MVMPAVSGALPSGPRPTRRSSGWRTRCWPSRFPSLVIHAAFFNFWPLRKVGPRFRNRTRSRHDAGDFSEVSHAAYLCRCLCAHLCCRDLSGACAAGRTVIADRHRECDGHRVDTGARWPDQTVVVTGNRISAVGQAASVTRPPGARVVDGRGKFLMPGLWDTHVHALFNGFDRAMPYLAAIGITSVRDMANSFQQLADARRPRQDSELHRATARGRDRSGARRCAAELRSASGPSRGSARDHDTRAGAGLVKTLASAKVDAIKVRNVLDDGDLHGDRPGGEALGFPFDGHLPPTVNIVQASDAGQRVVEHLQGLAALCAANPAALDQGRGQGAGPAQGQAPPPQPIEINRARCEETARHLVRNGTWLTPTIGAPVPGNNPVRQFNLRITQIAAQAGVPMLAGTDWPGIQFSNGQRSVHQELAGLVEAGLTPQQALRTATVNPAMLFNLNDQLGSIEQGKLADLLLLDGDPLMDITNITKIAAVVVNGKLIDPALRQKMLDDFEAVLKEAAATRQASCPERRCSPQSRRAAAVSGGGLIGAGRPRQLRVTRWLQAQRHAVHVLGVRPCAAHAREELFTLVVLEPHDDAARAADARGPEIEFHAGAGLERLLASAPRPSSPRQRRWGRQQLGQPSARPCRLWWCGRTSWSDAGSCS